MTPPAGYSGTPLLRKLGLRHGMAIRLLDPPMDYGRLLGHSLRELDIAVLDGEAGSADFTHLFVTRQDALEAGMAGARAGMAEDGMVWVSWPKKSSGVATEVGRADVMAAGKAAGLVDVKVCAVNDTWSGLKFVIPVADRRARR